MGTEEGGGARGKGGLERWGRGWMDGGQRDGWAREMGLRCRAGEMALRLSSLAAFPEDSSLVPTIRIAARNHLSFWFWGI